MLLILVFIVAGDAAYVFTDTPVNVSIISFAIGGITTPMVELLKKGLVGKVIDVQDFDLGAVNSIGRTPGHCEMSASQYANPANKGAFVNQLDFVILAALEVDTSFNVNVLTGSGLIWRTTSRMVPSRASITATTLSSHWSSSGRPTME